MKYYKLIESINNKEIGVYPQVIKTDQALEIQEFGLGYNEHLHKQFILPEPILRNNARETTMISVTAINNNIFLVLKNYFIDFLKNFKIANFQSWKIDVYHKKQLVDDSTQINELKQALKSIIEEDINQDIENKDLKYHQIFKKQLIVNYLTFNDYTCENYKIIDTYKNKLKTVDKDSITIISDNLNYQYSQDEVIEIKEFREETKKINDFECFKL